MDTYEGRLDDIRKEYESEGVYLDNAAMPLTPSSLIYKSADFLAKTPMVNPHSNNALSHQTSGLINEVRQRALSLLGTSTQEYALVFTANATAAAKLVGECVENYMYLVDSHTSMVGIRGYTNNFKPVHDIPAHLDELDAKWVAAWPLQSNFDGRRYPPKWVQDVDKTGALSLLDIASYCSTSLPDLGSLRPDFAVLSFYKIFGLPDLGALLVKKCEKTSKFFQKRRYFGGGTVAALTAQEDFMIRNTDLVTSLEDGTLPLHSIGMLSVAMTQFPVIFGSYQAISNHILLVARYCYDRLRETAQVSLLSEYPDNLENGPIVTFVLNSAGYTEFENVCSKLKIYVRVGTLCNTGAFTNHSKISDKDIIANHVKYNKTCNDDQDTIDGKYTGVIRVSPGPWSSFEDVDKLIDCISTYFGSTKTISQLVGSGNAEIAALYVYPIKSCAALSVESTQVLPQGLEWDREFCLIDLDSGKGLSLKKHHRMAKIFSKPNIKTQELDVVYDGATISIPMDPTSWPDAGYEDGVEFCSDRSSDMYVNKDPEVVRYFSTAVGIPCTIGKVKHDNQRHMKSEPESLSNTSPILLISDTSAKSLDNSDHNVFRANIVVKTEAPFQEDSWMMVRIGAGNYELLGSCRRCNMVCITKEGKSDPKPYLALVKSRRVDGKLWFGQHMRLMGSTAQITVGQKVTAITER